MIIRPALRDELDELSALCLRAKAYWPYDAAFIEACREELTITPEDLERHTIMVGEKNNIPIGVIRLDRIDDGYDLDLLFVEPDYIGKGVGRQLLEWGIGHAAAQGGHLMTTVADPNAEAFYAHMGFKRVGEYASRSIPGRTLPAMERAL